VLGWFKLLPTFGGCVLTASTAKMSPERPGRIEMVVDYTTGKKVRSRRCAAPLDRARAAPSSPPPPPRGAHDSTFRQRRARS
jgi:hypothetical protein